MRKLFNELMDAYSDQNLNRITGKLIDLYKNKHHLTIREIANKISKYVIIEEEKDAKCFSKLIMLYHPDRGEFFRKSLSRYYVENDLVNLEKFSHILLVDKYIDVKVTELVEDIDYHPEYVWDEPEDEEDEVFHPEFYDEYGNFDPGRIVRTFYNALKLSEFGRLDVGFSYYFMEDYEEIELTQFGIDSLDGVEYCFQLVSLDLSGNQISDLSNLWDLKQLEELYLADNIIGYIDALSNLSKLRVLDLSGNQIDDITPLLELERLEYVNLTGNKIPRYQVELLKLGNVIVTC